MDHFLTTVSRPVDIIAHTIVDGRAQQLIHIVRQTNQLSPTQYFFIIIINSKYTFFCDSFIFLYTVPLVHIIK